MTELPQIMHYTEGEDPSPRFISRAAFESMLVAYRPGVLGYLGATASRPGGPVKPTWVDILQPDGTTVVGGVAGHSETHGSTGGDGSGAGF